MKDDNPGRQPDYVNRLYFKSNQGQDRHMDLPPSWLSKSGRLVTETPLGRLVQTPREMLERLREENRQASELEQDQDMSPEQ